MKKLHTLAFYALATPIITLGAGPVLAQSTSGQDMDRTQQSSPRDQGATPSTSKTPGSAGQSGQSAPRDQGAMPSTSKTPGAGSAGQSGQSTPRDQGAMPSTTPKTSQSQSGVDSRSASGQAHMQHKGFISSAPARGMHSDNLIGADVKTAAGEEVGPVTDLVISENGQIVAIVVSVGGFLGMGERHVAIGWDDVTRSGAADDLELQISSTRDALRSAPEFKKLED